MSFVSRGFHGRRTPDAESARVPPGQYVTTDFPVLSAGPTPHTPVENWDLQLTGEIDEPRRWSWEEPDERPDVYVCGPTPFVEAVSSELVKLGHEPARVKTERFGPMGG
jgi:hypothetical protein